jgi:hypothetical protein
MEKSTLIYPGTVFTAKNYDPFTKKVLSHPFVCIYDQALDQDLDAETNILALLITSNNKQFARQVPIMKADNPFLEKDSFCYCNNIYMFLKTDINVIGQLDSDTFFEIVKKRQLLLRGENDQCVQALMNMKAYEFKIKQREKEQKALEEKKAQEEKALQNQKSVNQNNQNNQNKNQNKRYQRQRKPSPNNNNNNKPNQWNAPIQPPKEIDNASNSPLNPSSLPSSQPSPLPNEKKSKWHNFSFKKNSNPGRE